MKKGVVKMSKFICKHKEVCQCLTCENIKCKREQCKDCRILGFSVPTKTGDIGCKGCEYVCK